MALTRTFLDSGVLLAAYKTERSDSDLALGIFEDGNRELVTSDLVRLEIIPQAAYHKQKDEVEFLETCLSFAKVVAPTDQQLVASAEQFASRYGLHAIDALHVAAAIATGCVELITTERPTKPLFRTSEIRVIFLEWLR
jgi:predicted nucleic acid-binding protein